MSRSPFAVRCVPFPFRPLLAALVFLFLATFFCSAARAAQTNAPGDAAALAACLPQTPKGVGAPIADREAWKAASRWPAIQGLARDAREYLGQPIPVLDDAVIEKFRQTGNRQVFEMPMRLRTTRLNAFVVAECLENEGRFLPAIEKEMTAILDEPTWSIGAFSTGKDDRTRISLPTAPRAWNLATADYWLGGKLPAELRQRLRRELNERVFDPYLADARAKEKRFVFFQEHVNNWGPVCHAGVVGAALAILETPEERARIVAAALPSLRRYLSGSTISEEGLSWEGVGYWDYGFGNYLLLAEALWQNSGGKINLYAGEPAARTATAVRGLELSHGTYPAFSDCPLYARPNTAILWLIKERFGMKGPGWPETPDGVQGEMRPGWAFSDEPGRPDPHALVGSMFGLHPLGDRLAAYGIFAFPVPPGVANASASEPDKLRSLFPKTGLAVLRDFTPGRPVLSLAVKGNHNGEPHGHHDQGSYVVAVDGWPLLTDPGSELYTPATFDGRRFESMMNNSLGHPVPLVAGKAQRDGTQARSVMTFQREGGERDVIELDLTACYDVPELKKLTRTYTFSRKERRIEIADAVEFSAPRAFGSAFVTNSPWKESDPARFKVSDGGVGVSILVESRDGTLDFKPEPVTAPRQRAGIAPVRIGYTLREPVTKAKITTAITSDEAAR